jgi:hypothetical protein
VLASTEQFTPAELHLLPGQLSETETHRLPEASFLQKGKIEVRMPHDHNVESISVENEGGYQLPAGTPHRQLNNRKTPARLLFQLAGTIRDSGPGS